MRITFTDIYTNKFTRPIIVRGQSLFDAKTIAFAINDQNYLEHTKNYDSRYRVDAPIHLGDGCRTKTFLTDSGMWRYLKDMNQITLMEEFLVATEKYHRNKIFQCPDEDDNNVQPSQQLPPITDRFIRLPTSTHHDLAYHCYQTAVSKYFPLHSVEYLPLSKINKFAEIYFPYPEMYEVCQKQVDKVMISHRTGLLDAFMNQYTFPKTTSQCDIRNAFTKFCVDREYSNTWYSERVMDALKCRKYAILVDENPTEQDKFVYVLHKND